MNSEKFDVFMWLFIIYICIAVTIMLSVMSKLDDDMQRSEDAYDRIMSACGYVIGNE